MPAVTDFSVNGPLDEPTLWIPIGKIVHQIKEAADVAI